MPKTIEERKEEAFTRGQRAGTLMKKEHERRIQLCTNRFSEAAERTRFALACSAKIIELSYTVGKETVAELHQEQQCTSQSSQSSSSQPAN